MDPATITETELSESSGASLELIRRLVGWGVVPDRGGERPFVPGDIHRVRVAQAFEDSGISLEAIGSAIASGQLSFDFVDDMFIGHTPLSGKTFREVADDLGIPLDTLTRLYAMWGLPRPGPDEAVRADDAPIFSEWKALFPPEAMNEELLTQGARLFGEVTTHLADWGMDLYRTYVEAPMRAAGKSAQETMDASGAFAQAGTPMMERQLSWLLGRKLEHNVIQLIVEHVEEAIEATGTHPPVASRPPAICFVDLSGYTALTEQIGDQAAADRAGIFGTLIQELAHSHGGRVVKLLGDGGMLHFPDPSEAVACAMEMVTRVEAAGFPPARAGIAAGPVVFRDGDCYGRVVNVAARVTDKAGPRQVLATTEVVTLTAPSRARFQPVGRVALKGIASPIDLSVAVPPD